ncbi:efflux transporter, RND family, MFP subunit [Pirellula staleyi DSM 6068]|uniref:Efflux transporter, RND family, MFP subunit n=1 Tax=Pirellula staleyi (strain ATCC 27377 / DSM 6068 / ICPB 4128) TaxID=530564 RepID=D2R978_PIRSD|nr:efflux RND transporter periplasmic adaptor subunit [Pirellula staleyi]ADB15905.1 efflux transporter, RND family, MFP subunit [Pirellula staleyi DSM 6068]
MATQVDLRQLTVDRVVPETPRARKRGTTLSWGLPLLTIAGFVALVGWSARDFWLPAAPVTIMPVLLTRAEVQQAGTPLFQAAGWIEPRPTAVICSALVEGVVEQLLVVEGQNVEANQPIARLVDADVRLQLAEAESILLLRQAERDAARAAVASAQSKFDQPVHLEAEHAEADAALATLETEINNLPFLIQSARARFTLARQDLEAKQQVADAIAGRSIQKAQSEFDAASATLADLEQRGTTLARQQAAWQRRCEALHTKLKLKTDETLAAADSQARLTAAEAHVRQAELAIETIQLRLARMTVCSPIQGRVLALHTRPGSRLMGLTSASESDSSSVASLYDPKQLQVRVDVRLEDVSQVQLGQSVQLTTSASPAILQGVVLGITSQADIQKNTLQVKVSITDPPEVLRPEMLAQVTFLAPQSARPATEANHDPLRMLVPQELVETSESGASVWIIDGSQTIARRQTIQLGEAKTSELVEVIGGLTALDKLIVAGRDELADGARIRVTGADRSLGTSRDSMSAPVTTARTAQPTSPTTK